MRIIACITHSADIRKILDHIGVEAEPPLWDACDAQIDDAVQMEPQIESDQVEPDWTAGWDDTAQAVPDFEVDQRVNW